MPGAIPAACTLPGPSRSITITQTDPGFADTPVVGRVSGSFTPTTCYGQSDSVPLPVSCRPYNYASVTTASPWNLKVPANPGTVKTAAGTTWLAAVFTGGDKYGNSCPGVTSCWTTINAADGTRGGYPIWQASASMVAVTFECTTAQTSCTKDDVTGFEDTTGNFTISGFIEATARPGATGCDCNMAVPQPNGTEIEVYNCIPTRNFINGDVIGGPGGGTNCSGDTYGMAAFTNLATDQGLTGAVDTGDSYLDRVVYYNQWQANNIPHTFQVTVGCTIGFHYPATSQANACAGGVTNAFSGGDHLHLRLTDAQIATKIASSEFIAADGPAYYALAHLGFYVIDTGCYTAAEDMDDCGGSNTPKLESPQPWYANGGTNPWLTSSIFSGRSTSSGTLTFAGDNFWGTVAPYMEVVGDCYATGTCSDSASVFP